MDYQSYLSHNVAVNLKRIRTSKGMSLDVLSEQTSIDNKNRNHMKYTLLKIKYLKIATKRID